MHNTVTNLQKESKEQLEVIKALQEETRAQKEEIESLQNETNSLRREIQELNKTEHQGLHRGKMDYSLFTILVLSKLKK